MFDAVRPVHPPEFARLPMRMVRAATAADVYAHPRAELARLTDLGLLHRVATGFYVAVPDDRVGAEWMPGMETAAAGISVAAYGRDDAVVMGVSAARLHGVIPRASSTAVMAVPTRHDPIRLADRQAVVRFVVRDTARLDSERIDTELGRVLVTTAEQTVLDLVKRPGLGDAECEVWPAVEQLYRTCDPTVLAEIAEASEDANGFDADAGSVGGEAVNPDELDSVARQFGVARAQVERDHLISHLLGYPSAHFAADPPEPRCRSAPVSQS